MSAFTSAGQFLPKAVCFQAMTLAAATLVGCSGGRPAAVALPDVSPATAASKALELFDADKNGSLDAKELEACPPLVAALAQYDGDKDGNLSAAEIESRLTSLYGAGTALTGVECRVTYAGRPLPEATVTFRPVKLLEGELQTAQGTTDETGSARLSMPADQLPEKLKDAPLMQAGLYHVEITHPKLANSPQYNSKSTLGFQVDPVSRGGTVATFSLK